MRLTSLISSAVALASGTMAASSTVSSMLPLKTAGLNETIYTEFELYKPQVFIINMFEYEQERFLEGYDLVHNITIPGLSPIYPDIHCNANYTLCQVTTGEGEINAATTLTALSLSPLFDLTETYWLIAGIAGVSPLQGTIGDVTFARFAVQILEYEVDAREMPSNWTTGYFPFGTTYSNQYPGNVYGTEVFELNEDLRDRAIELASAVELSNGTVGNAEFRALYDYAPANSTPKVTACDTLTSDTYWFGEYFDETFTNYTDLITNGTATYCTTQQEDNATLEALMRAAQYGLVDFSRIICMRSASDFTYADYYANETTYLFNEVSQGGSKVSVVNLFLAGQAVIDDVLTNWDTLYSNNTFANTNYIGDMFGSLEDPVYREWGVLSWGTA
ncbi:hypothetical protein CANARDRAFT_29765 [[Candida] arabinofermentans NRRL YB-2248]|uniref:Uncharacterized protein n=1 Tax=[Candida] arabinofermentans NRRL YB-2248 TaxID=983967 RepID=A0A1E4SWB1_9ASCO|nr:hypothetical protein CANARDRAFT_29765 [[Candida] arabinofermentans NRRL YB-2248]